MKVQLLYNGNCNRWQCAMEYRFVEQSVLDDQLARTIVCLLSV